MSTPILPTYKLKFVHERKPDDSYFTVLDGGEPAPFVPDAHEGVTNGWKTPFPMMTAAEHLILVRVCSLVGCVVSAEFAFHVAVLPSEPTELGIIAE